MDGLTLLAEAMAAGLEVWAEGDKLVIRGPKQAEEVAKGLLVHKQEVLAHLRHRGTSLYDLPFPLGYGDLPKAQVEAAEVINDKLGIVEPVH